MSHRPPGYLAWPLPAAGGAIAGTLLQRLLGAVAGGETSPPALLLPTVLVVSALAVGALVLASRLRRGRRRAGLAGVRLAPLALGPLALGPLALALVAGVAAGGRYLAWESRPNPAQPYLGHETVWHGRYDGAVFRSDEPVPASFKLVSLVEPPGGRLTLKATAEPAPGRRNPGGFDYAAYLRRRGIAGQLFVAEVLESVPLPGARQRLERGVRAGLDAEAGALLSALTLGLKDDLGHELEESFARAGMAHLLALSGLHFGVLLGSAALLLRRVGRLRDPLLLLLVGGFVLLVGPAPSVVRAALMAGAYLSATLLGVGRLEALPVLSLAALAALLLQPQMLFDLSFQLSYLALIGLIIFTGPLAALAGRRRIPGGRFVSSGLAASVAAQLPSLSLVAGTFGMVPLFSPLTNLVAIPLSGLLVPLGFAAGLLGLVSERLAALVNLPTQLLADLLTGVARLADALPAVAWAEIGWLGHLCWAACVLALALFLRRRLGPRQLLLVVLAAGGSTTVAGGAARPPDVWFLDVGQGDATLIRLPGRYEVLIDGGGSPFSDDDVAERIVLPALRALDVDELELVIATHPDADHVEGLFTVLQRLPVANLVTGPAAPGNALDDELRALAAERGVSVHVATRGEAIVLGRHGEAVLEVLHPPAGGGGGSANEESVVLLLRYRGVPAVLLLADVGSVTERQLALGRVAVLRVGHHGSRFSTSPELLYAIAPPLAVISVGRNNYGHPHPDVLQRLAVAGVVVRSTAAVGALRLDLAQPARLSTLGGE